MLQPGCHRRGKFRKKNGLSQRPLSSRESDDVSGHISIGCGPEATVDQATALNCNCNWRDVEVAIIDELDMILTLGDQRRDVHVGRSTLWAFRNARRWCELAVLKLDAMLHSQYQHSKSPRVLPSNRLAPDSLRLTQPLPAGPTALRAHARSSIHPALGNSEPKKSKHRRPITQHGLAWVSVGAAGKLGLRKNCSTVTGPTKAVYTKKPSAWPSLLRV